VVPRGHRSGRGVCRPALSRYVATEGPMTFPVGGTTPDPDGRGC
jgi:hypothetical protein